MMGIYPSSLPSLLRTPALNLLPPTLLQLVLLPPTPLQLLKIHIVPTFHSLLFPLPMTEQEAVHQSVKERQLSPSTSSSPATMMWPLLEEYPSMSSPPRATSVHFQTLPYRCGRFLRATPESGYHWLLLQASDDV